MALNLPRLTLTRHLIMASLTCQGCDGGGGDPVGICRCVVIFALGFFPHLTLFSYYKGCLNPCPLTLYVYLSLCLFFHCVCFGKMLGNGS